MLTRLSDWRVIAASGALNTAPLDTLENTLLSLTIPGNSLGANGLIRLSQMWFFTNNANAKQLRVRFGGVALITFNQINFGGFQHIITIQNRNNTGAQMTQSANPPFGSFSVDIRVGSNVDTTVDQPLLITMEKAVGADACRLETYIVEICRVN